MRRGVSLFRGLCSQGWLLTWTRDGFLLQGSQGWLMTGRGWLPFAIWGAKIGDFWIFSKKNKEILLFAVLFLRRLGANLCERVVNHASKGIRMGLFCYVAKWKNGLIWKKEGQFGRFNGKKGGWNGIFAYICLEFVFGLTFRSRFCT